MDMNRLALIIPVILTGMLVTPVSRALVDDDQDPEKIASALLEKLTPALALQQQNLQHGMDPQTAARTYNDGLPMWMILYVRPNQNDGHTGYFEKGFFTGGMHGPYGEVRDIASADSFGMKHESPWSMKLAGIGEVSLFRDPDFHGKAWLTIQSYDDTPKNHSWVTRQVTGSVRFCPGVAFYLGADFRGEGSLLDHCSPKPEESVCIEGNELVRKAGSLHADRMIDRVVVYDSPGCKGGHVTFLREKEPGTISTIPSFMSGKIRSVELHFGAPRLWFTAPAVAR